MKTFKENQLIICDQLREPIKYYKGLVDSHGYVQIIGFGEVHINNFQVYGYDIVEILEQNYQAIRSRGLIKEDTDFYDFMEKLEEETQEMANEYHPNMHPNKHTKAFESEYIDTLTVLLNMGRHMNIDIIKGLKDNAEKQWSRAKHIDINEL